MMERTAYSVPELPFWRWAVAIEERADLPAIPFYREASARVFADEVRQRFPDRTTVLLRRGWSGLTSVVIGGN